jgi:hypothetical protein
MRSLFSPQPELVLSTAKDVFYLNRYVIPRVLDAISKSVQSIDFVERFGPEIKVRYFFRRSSPLFFIFGF